MVALEDKFKKTIWVARSLFDRGKTSGSSANISFIHENRIYISGSGSCFATLEKESFAIVDLSGKHLEGVKASKELPLHQMFYRKKGIEAVIHTHSFYSVLWSCLNHGDSRDIMPEYTPYLKIKLGTVGLVPYAPPGSRELFQKFEDCLPFSDGFLLANHGPVVGGKNIMEAFYAIEELEESAKTAWYLRNEKRAELLSG